MGDRLRGRCRFAFCSRITRSVHIRYDYRKIVRRKIICASVCSFFTRASSFEDRFNVKQRGPRRDNGPLACCGVKFSVKQRLSATTLRATRNWDATRSPLFCRYSPLTHHLNIGIVKLQRNHQQSIKMSSTPSSRRRGHSSRNSQSSTPAQQSQSTPRSTRQAPNGNAAPSSSPLFFQSSPRRQAPGPPSQLASDGMIISSPPRHSSDAGDREVTPRPTTRPIDGTPLLAMLWNTI